MKKSVFEKTLTRNELKVIAGGGKAIASSSRCGNIMNSLHCSICGCTWTGMSCVGVSQCL